MNPKIVSYRPELLDEMQGDLYELFQRRIKTEGAWKARILYWLNVLMFLHPSFIKKKRVSLNPANMLENYLKTAFRHLTKYKLYSFINITHGLEFTGSSGEYSTRSGKDSRSYQLAHSRRPAAGSPILRSQRLQNKNLIQKRCS